MVVVSSEFVSETVTYVCPKFVAVAPAESREGVRNCFGERVIRLTDAEVERTTKLRGVEIGVVMVAGSIRVLANKLAT